MQRVQQLRHSTFQVGLEWSHENGIARTGQVSQSADTTEAKTARIAPPVLQRASSGSTFFFPSPLKLQVHHQDNDIKPHVWLVGGRNPFFEFPSEDLITAARSMQVRAIDTPLRGSAPWLRIWTYE